MITNYQFCFILAQLKHPDEGSEQVLCFIFMLHKQYKCVLTADMPGSIITPNDKEELFRKPKAVTPTSFLLNIVNQSRPDFHFPQQ